MGETMAVIGVLSMLGLIALTVRDRGETTIPQLLGALVNIAGQGVIYGFQFSTSRELDAVPAPAGALAGYAVLVVILFALGISRAWEFVGADTPSIIRLLVGLGRRSSM